MYNNRSFFGQFLALTGFFFWFYWTVWFLNAMLQHFGLCFGSPPYC